MAAEAGYLTIDFEQNDVRSTLLELTGGRGPDKCNGGESDPTRIITHTLPLQRAPYGYDIFTHKQDGCEKIVLRP